MHLEFNYSLEEDVKNWIKATKSINNPNPTRMHLRYIEKYGEVFEAAKLSEFIQDYLRKENIRIDERVEDARVAWDGVKVEFLKRADRIFKQTLDVDIVKVFLTTDRRASYNLDGSYFFFSIHAKSSNLTLMHELFHFYTWQVFHGEVESEQINKRCYNDVKESLTELLNVECSDLLDGAEDKGYPQHQEMRAFIQKKWLETRDIVQVFESAKTLCES